MGLERVPNGVGGIDVEVGFGQKGVGGLLSSLLGCLVLVEFGTWAVKGISALGNYWIFVTIRVAYVVFTPTAFVAVSIWSTG